MQAGHAFTGLETGSARNPGRNPEQMAKREIPIMKGPSFLECIYHGSWDQSSWDAARPRQDSSKISRILDDYRKLLEEFPPHEMEAMGRLPEEVLGRMASIGVFGLAIPETYGGLGFNLWEYLQTVQEMVKLDMAMALTSIAHASIGVKGIELFGTTSQKERYLPGAARGAPIFAFALTEPRIGSDARNIETHAELSPNGDHYLLNGQKTYITNANYAGALTVFAQLHPRGRGGMGAFIVETGWDGVKIGKDMPKMGLKSSSTAPIQFKDVRVPVENLLGEAGEGFKVAMTVLNYGRIALGAASVGMMEKSLQDMHKRASTRLQFGRPIGRFPLVQEKIVRAKTAVLVSSAMNSFVAGMLESNPTAQAAVETSHCKLFGTTRAWDTLYDAFQVAGGSAYLTTQPYEKRLRDFRVATVFEGTSEIHSFYPALSAFRNLARLLQSRRLTVIGRILLLLRNAFRPVKWPMRFAHPTLRAALREGRAIAGTIRRMLFLSLLLYGRAVFERQFLQRRITTLSMHLLGLLSIVAKAGSGETQGGLRQDEWDLLAYFIQQAREIRKANRRLRDAPLERMTARLSG